MLGESCASINEFDYKLIEKTEKLFPVHYIEKKEVGNELFERIECIGEKANVSYLVYKNLFFRNLLYGEKYKAGNLKMKLIDRPYDEEKTKDVRFKQLEDFKW